MSSFIERMIERDIESINDHLPSVRVPLSEFSTSEHGIYETRNGEGSVIRASEIQLIKEHTPPEFHDRIRLPIVLLRRIDLGPGIYTISGTKIESFLLHHLIDDHLGDHRLDWSMLPTWTLIERLARPQVQLIRRILPSATCIGFTTITKGSGTTRSDF